MTELDDAIEQVLGKFIPDTIWRIQARNEICALISQADKDTAATVREPDDWMTDEHKAAAIEGFLSNPTAVAYAAQYREG